MEPHSSIPEGVQTDRIDLVIPGRPEYVAVARLAAAAIAGRMAFTFDEIEDLKVAVGEVCSSAILAGAPKVQIGFDVRGEQLDITVVHSPTKPPRARREPDLDKLLVQVLMDEVLTRTDGAEHLTRMSKRVAKG